MTVQRNTIILHLIVLYIYLFVYLFIYLFIVYHFRPNILTLV